MEEITLKIEHMWEDNIKIYLWEIRFGGVDWIHMVQDRGLCWTLHEHDN
jgi:hypothetical protein